MLNHATLTKFALVASLVVPAVVSIVPVHAEEKGSTTYVYKDGRNDHLKKVLKRGLKGYDKLDLSGLENLPRKNSITVPELKLGDWTVR